MPELSRAAIADTLSRLRAARPAVFGSSSHCFRLSPALPEADVVKFERIHGVVLPNAYRQFLTCIGNGGAGPFYGVFPLGRVDDNFDLRDWHEGDGLVGILSEPFPLQESWNDLSAKPTDELASRDQSEYDKQIEAFEREYWRASLVNGAIPICHEGCAIRIYLVLTGPQAGYLWEDRRSEYGGLNPLRLSDGSCATFASWYDEWLKASLAERTS
jgi:hypothetical protein